MKRTFVQDPGVTSVLQDAHVTDEDLRQVETAILKGGGTTIAQTGGLRKIRCAAKGKGKSGAVRILFADYPRFGRTYMLAAFAKNEKANVTPKERNELRKIKGLLDRALERAAHEETSQDQ